MKATYRDSKIRICSIVATLFLTIPGRAQAQEWSESRIVEEALERNPRLREARMGVVAARASADVAASFKWPDLNVGVGWTRSDDPVFAFGAKLRQGRFSENDFSLGELNAPDAIDDWTTGVQARWGILSGERWASSAAADHEAEAVTWTAERVAQEVRYSARVLFQQAVASEARVEAARLDVLAKSESLRVIRRRVEEGVLTEVDALRAEAEWQSAEATSATRRQAHSDARARLAFLLARDPSEIGPLSASDPVANDADGTAVTVDGRADLRAFSAQLEAAERRVGAARGARFPSLSAFASWNTYARGPLDDPQSRWTGGIALSVPVFTGFESGARIAAAEARLEAARIRRHNARRRAEMELAEALRAVETSVGVRRSADAATEAADEALRLMRRRFEEGLATTGDLLNAQARAGALRSSAVDARSRHYIALARVEWVALSPLNNREALR